MAAALPLDDAQAQLLALAKALPVEECPVEEALDRYLAQPLVANRTQPPADLSAMDGYAICGPDYAGPWRIIGESAAGLPFNGTIHPGDAVRISTGAWVPDGADTILLQEDASAEHGMLMLAGDTPRTSQHIRRSGFDFATSDCLLEAGQKVTPAVIALALAAGHSALKLHRKPRIAIIDSGDELSADPAYCAPHQIPASNGAMLAAMARAVPCEIARLGPVPDDRRALADALARAQDADLIVTSGGASVGDHDLVRPALKEWGAEIAFWKVAMKPGKPIMVARRGAQVILGLPGNPVSSYVTAYLFLLPLLRALSGASACLPQVMHCPVASSLKPGGKRLEFLRARWDGREATPLGEQDSSGLSALATANALVVRQVDASEAAPGTLVPIYLLENGGIA